MVTVREAISLWEEVGDTLSATEQGIKFRELLSQKAPDAKLPVKTSRLRYHYLFILHVCKQKRTRHTHIQVKYIIRNRSN